MLKKMSGNEEEPVMTPIVSGVLCFMSTARHSMRADDMVRVCHSFYKEDDINKAKDILLDMITDPAKSIPKRRRGKDKLIHELEDINELLVSLISIPDLIYFVPIYVTQP